jgi:hypothetical protein
MNQLGPKGESTAHASSVPKYAVLREFLVRAGASLVGRVVFQGIVSLWIEVASHW